MLNTVTISSKKRIPIIYIILTLTTLAVFWQVNGYDFINYDDTVYVTENSHVQSGFTLDGLRWAFSTIKAEFWHPLTWLSLMFDYQLHGLNPGGFHLTNLVLHILSTLLLFRLLQRMTGAVWKSAFVAAFFAIHPLRVESVAWIAERKDVLSALFWMLTLCSYVYYTEKPVMKRYWLVCLFFACGFMSKPTVVSLPVIMILLDYWPLRRFESHRGNIILWQLREKITFFIFSAVFSWITLYAHWGLSAENWRFSFESRMVNAVIAFVMYLRKIFWPHDLAVCYPFFGDARMWQISGAVLLIIAISTYVILKIKRFPFLFVGWFWYSISILPVIGIIPVGNNAMADRYIYLPFIGISMMLAWGIPLLFPGEGVRKKILFPLSMAVLVILAVLTWRQCGYWKNDTVLWSYVVTVARDNDLAHCNLGIALFSKGETEEAIHHYNTAISLSPTNVTSYHNRGNAYAILGRYQHAIEDYNEAIRLNPDSFETYNNRGNAYAILGRYQHAIEDYNEALRLNPFFAETYNNRGNAYIIQKNNEQGCKDLKKACEFGKCKLLEDVRDRGLCR